jgi:hypothetical protein
MSQFVAYILTLIKWPLAIVMAFLFIPAGYVLLDLLQLDVFTEHFAYFFIFFIAVVALWFFLVPELRNSFLNTFEHEFTHLIFAVLSGNIPTGMDVNHGSGYFSYRGHTNWLIVIAPYFFPTFPVLVILAGLIMRRYGIPLNHIYWAVYGTVVGMYLSSTICEIRANQTDFKKSGYLFSFLFLPTAILISCGLLFVFAVQGFSGFDLYFSLFIKKIHYFISYLK